MEDKKKSTSETEEVTPIITTTTTVVHVSNTPRNGCSSSLEGALRAILKCLGLETAAKPEGCSSSCSEEIDKNKVINEPPSCQEQQTSSNPGGGEAAADPPSTTDPPPADPPSTPVEDIAIQRRPPVNSGNGPQTNTNNS
ncbi:hypothetical protein LOK49_LG05G02876 [Camellia lanceoleosa]|uniref:Uncharacterized protein n=1 Tax=Camellia lanceoleosa TaxID=1840588 RepID=A0ACC0HMD0_9ERIC|nr:hypothetical protein LOK49_LG05G02876 [Camellia lanceoleosa]